MTALRAALQLQAALKRLQRLLPPAAWEQTERGGDEGGLIVLGRGEGERGREGGLFEHMVSAHVTAPGAEEESMKCNNAKRRSELLLSQLSAAWTLMCLNNASVSEEDTTWTFGTVFHLLNNIFILLC